MILIVDDHDDIRIALAMLIKMEGFETVQASSGLSALSLMRARRPHCVILDFNMPGMDGLEVLAAVRADPQLASTRVILFSAQGDDLRQRALAAGADAYVQKCSLDFAALRRELFRHCRPTREPVPFEPAGPPPPRRSIG